MKRLKLIQLWFLFLLCIGFAVWAPYASAQQTKPSEEVAKEVEKTMPKSMPILKGEQWLKLDPNSKVAFIWGAAHVIVIENVLMEEIPELKVGNFSAKVAEARQADVSAGKEKTINQIVSAIDRYFRDHPDRLSVPVMLVIWEFGVLPNLKTGIAGRPLD
jgi:hypothetical protein